MKFMDKPIAILHCDYDEGEPGSYRGHYVAIGGRVYLFNAVADPLINKECALKWVRDDLKLFCLNSSDIDYFEKEWDEEGCFII